MKSAISAALVLSTGIAVANPCDETSLPDDKKAQCNAADALFNQRGEMFDSKQGSFDDRAKIAYDAIAAYKEVLPFANGKDRAYIASKVARSYIYIGDYLIPKSEPRNRYEVFDECMKFIESDMKIDQIGDNLQPYYYSKAACWAFRLEVSNVLVKLREKGQLEKLVYEGVSYGGGNDYMGGAIYRSLAAIRSSKAAIAIGAGNTVEAESAALEAIDTPENSLFNDYPLAGEDYCDNYRYLARAYIYDSGSDNYDPDEAAGAIEMAFSQFGVDIDSNSGAVTVDNAPEGFEVDTKLCVARLVDMAKEYDLDVSL